MGKLNKNERHMSFILKLCFFFLYYSEKVDLLKAIDAVNFEEVNKIKLLYFQANFKQISPVIHTQQNYRLPVVSVFTCLFLFSVCAFMGKLPVDCNLKLLALLWVIRFFYPLGLTRYYLVKRKREEQISKYFQMSALNVCNIVGLRCCVIIDVIFHEPWYISPIFAWSCCMSRLV